MATMRVDVTAENRPDYSPGKLINVTIEVDGGGETLTKIKVVSKSESYFSVKSRSRSLASRWNTL